MDDEFGDDIDWSAVPNVGGTAAAISTNNNNSMTNRGGGALHQQMGATANVYNNNTNTHNTNSAYPQQNIGNMGFDYTESNSQPSLTTNNNNFVAPQPAPTSTNYTSTNNYSSTDTNVLQKQVSCYIA